MIRFCALFLLLFAGNNSSLYAQKKITLAGADEGPKGDALRWKGDLPGAVSAYRKMYDFDSSYSANIYKLAACYSLLRKFDSCFYFLYKVNNLNPSVEALVDPDFYFARQDKRWENFETELINVLLKKDENHFQDVDYARKLMRLRTADQAYYYDAEVAARSLGRSSSVVAAIWDLKRKLNDELLKELEILLAQEGWPKISDVGIEAANAAFLIIQHSDLEKQKKYIPGIKKLCEEHEAVWQTYALMYDRIQVEEGKPQRYGSQVTLNPKTQLYELNELEDEMKVEEWRKEIGMVPLVDYVKQWKIKFEPGKMKSKSK